MLKKINVCHLSSPLESVLHTKDNRLISPPTEVLAKKMTKSRCEMNVIDHPNCVTLRSWHQGSVSSFANPKG